MYKFNPIENITAKELAKVIEALQLEISADMFVCLPMEVQRHFLLTGEQQNEK